MPIKDVKYKSNQAILKDFGGLFFKLTAFKVLRTNGIEDDVKKRPKGSVNDEKLQENISRARATIFELASCNQWQYWSTFTLDKRKYNRTDLGRFKRDFTQFIRDQRKRLGCRIEYLLVPELHADGQSWHMHGFINGLPESELRLFHPKEKLPKKLLEKLNNGDLVYDWLAYRQKFGFNDLELVRNQEACSKYITKYISKEMSLSILEVGAHLYYCSQGLRRAVVIKKGTIVSPMEPEYENDYVRVQIFKTPASVEDIKDMIL